MKKQFSFLLLVLSSLAYSENALLIFEFESSQDDAASLMLQSQSLFCEKLNLASNGQIRPVAPRVEDSLLTTAQDSLPLSKYKATSHIVVRVRDFSEAWDIYVAQYNADGAVLFVDAINVNRKNLMGGIESLAYKLAKRVKHTTYERKELRRAESPSDPSIGLQLGFGYFYTPSTSFEYTSTEITEIHGYTHYDVTFDSLVPEYDTVSTRHTTPNYSIQYAIRYDMRENTLLLSLAQLGQNGMLLGLGYRRNIDGPFLAWVFGADFGVGFVADDNSYNRYTYQSQDLSSTDANNGPFLSPVIGVHFLRGEKLSILVEAKGFGILGKEINSYGGIAQVSLEYR